MTEYEVLARVPSGLKVAIYHDDLEIMVQNVPASVCQTRPMLEAYLKRISAEKVKKLEIPTDVVSIRGRQPLR